MKRLSLVISNLFMFSSTELFARGMPWESPIRAIVTSLTGPVAAGISSLAFFIALASLAFGQDLSGFVRSMVILVLVVSGLLSIVSIINLLFGVSV